MNCKYIYPIAVVILIILSSSCRKSDYETDATVYISDDGSGTGTTTWKADQEYILDGLVFVNDGQTLTIEAGTIIQAKTGQGINASALIVSRGGKIIAQGNSQSPIIFTVEGDDLQGSTPLQASGLWGGLIILGNAPLNTSGGEARIEGIPISEPRGVFGGQNPEDNSGILQYVSIRHGGTNIGEGNEINGLTLGGVGNATLIDHVEVVSNADDGVEFFGGTVNCRYLVSAFCGDDAFDFDMGFQGKGQFWLAVQEEGNGNCLIEADGNADHISARPFTAPLISNLTAIGRGAGTGAWTCSFQNEGGAAILNSVFLNQENGVGLEFVAGGSSSYNHWKDGYTRFENNSFYDIANNTPAGIFLLRGEGFTEAQKLEWQQYFNDAGNKVSNPGILITEEGINPLPEYPDLEVNTISDTWFLEVNFRGAFYNDNWLRNWSYLDQSGFIF